MNTIDDTHFFANAQTFQEFNCLSVLQKNPKLAVSKDGRFIIYSKTVNTFIEKIVQLINTFFYQFQFWLGSLRIDDENVHKFQQKLNDFNIKREDVKKIREEYLGTELDCNTKKSELFEIEKKLSEVKNGLGTAQQEALILDKKVKAAELREQQLLNQIRQNENKLDLISRDYESLESKREEIKRINNEYEKAESDCKSKQSELYEFRRDLSVVIKSLETCRQDPIQLKQRAEAAELREELLADQYKIFANGVISSVNNLYGRCQDNAIREELSNLNSKIRSEVSSLTRGQLVASFL